MHAFVQCIAAQYLCVFFPVAVETSGFNTFFATCLWSTAWGSFKPSSMSALSGLMDSNAAGIATMTVKTQDKGLEENIGSPFWQGS